MWAPRLIAAVFVGLSNAGVLKFFTDAPEWAVLAMGLLGVTIVTWSTVGDPR